jgi:SRSO17 transposase
MSVGMKKTKTPPPIDPLDVFDPARWGLCLTAILDLGVRLYRFWKRYRPLFASRTRDTSSQAYLYLRAVLTMERERNFKNIDRRLNHGGDGQALQHFMSTSPWDRHAVFCQIQADLSAIPALSHGSLLILDESADAKAGEQSAGAARQRNGRLGKVDVCQVGTYLAYANIAANLWTLVDGELFLPEAWLTPAYADQRKACGVPAERVFQRKTDLGIQMIDRARANGLPFERVACDAFYGRDRQFRADLQAKNVLYAADIPADTHVYRQAPRVGIPPKRHRRGRTPTRWKVLSRQVAHSVSRIARSKRTTWQHLRLRPTERGWLEADFAVERVWTITEAGQVRAEWLVIRRELNGKCSYTLLNDPPDTPPETLIAASCQRYFTERVYEDAKTDLGWAEFQALKYRAWEHHLALTALALWFVAETKWQWAQTYARDPQLIQQLEIEVLPALSTANVCELLRAVLPVPTLTPASALQIVIRMLLDRAASTRSRLKTRINQEASP